MAIKITYNGHTTRLPGNYGPISRHHALLYLLHKLRVTKPKNVGIAYWDPNTNTEYIV